MPTVRATAAPQATPSVGATASACAGTEPAAAGGSPVLSVTSHSLSLSTRAFSVDFSWSRVETSQPGRAGGASATAAAPAASGTPPSRPSRRPPQSFGEMLRRQQLAQLLIVVPPTPRDAVLLSSAETPSSPQPGPVCRAYSQAQGPLAHSSLLFSA